MKGYTKPVFLLIIVVCLVMAAIISYHNYFRPNPPKGITAVDPNEMVLVKCSDPNCGITYQMSNRAYLEHISQHSITIRMETILPICKKCGKASMERAIKCEKCGTIFIYGKDSSDFPDKCPNCGHSKTLEGRKTASDKR